MTIDTNTKVSVVILCDNQYALTFLRNDIYHTIIPLIENELLYSENTSGLSINSLNFYVRERYHKELRDCLVGEYSGGLNTDIEVHVIVHVRNLYSKDMLVDKINLDLIPDIKLMLNNLDTSKFEHKNLNITSVDSEVVIPRYIKKNEHNW